MSRKELIKPDFLRWVYDRLHLVHGEDENYDYMRAFKEQIQTAINMQEEIEELKAKCEETEIRERYLQREVCYRDSFEQVFEQNGPSNTAEQYNDMAREIAEERGWNCYEDA